MTTLQQLLAASKKTPWQSTEIVNLIGLLRQQQHALPAGACAQLLAAIALNQDTRAFRSLYEHPDFSINAANTHGHTAAHCIAVHAYDNATSASAVLFLKKYGLDFTLTDAQDHTAADLAINSKKKTLAACLFTQEMDGSHFSRGLARFLDNAENQRQARDIVERTQKQIVAEIIRLSRVVQLPSSEIDETIEEALHQLGIIFTDVVDGYELPLPTDSAQQLSSTQARTLYALTPIGQLESKLNQAITDTLRGFADEENARLLTEWEAEHEAASAAAWETYNDEMADFEDGDYGYDYEGPVRPQTPDIEPFDAVFAEQQLQEKFPPNATIEHFLEHIDIEAGLLGDMLYNHFISMELIDNVVATINFESIGIDKALAARILAAIDWQFPDIDITQPGYLIAIFESNLSHFLYQNYIEYARGDIEAQLYEHIIDNEQALQLIRQFNQATTDIQRQRCWAALADTVQLAVKFYRQQDLKRQQHIAKAIENAKAKIPPNETLASMIKVFPTDQADSLIYASETGALCHQTVTCSLRPIMKTLYSIAANTHDCLTKCDVKNIEKTNIVTAMLSFVVDVTNPHTQQIESAFYHVPLTLDYQAILLSKDSQDGVFIDEHDFETSVGEDRHHASLVADGPVSTISPNRAQMAKQTLQRLVDTLALPGAQMAQIQAALANAEVAKPMALDFYTKESVQKSTAFYHSERVLLHALKSPHNVAKILTLLHQQITEAYPEAGDSLVGNMRIQTTNLILYSHPNSVCSECGPAIIAAQQPTTSAFLNAMENQLTQPECAFTGPVDASGERRPLLLNAIVASSHVFVNDASGQIVKKQPAAKCPYTQANVLTRNSGIFVGRKAAPNYFYEFTESNIRQSEQAPLAYNGIIAMSGSKAKKLTSVTIDTKIQTMLATHNQAVTSHAAH